MRRLRYERNERVVLSAVGTVAGQLEKERES